MTGDEKDKTASSESIEDIDDANVDADGAENVKGGFNPQPDPPKIRGFDPQPDPPFFKNPIQGGH